MSGIALEELAQPGREPGGAEADRGGDLDAPGRLLLALGQQRLGHRQLGEHLADRAVQALALLGQDQAAGVAVEQRDLEVLLEGRDLARDRGLAEVQGFARMGEAARFRHRVKHPKLVPIHPYRVPALHGGARLRACHANVASKTGRRSRLFRRHAAPAARAGWRPARRSARPGPPAPRNCPRSTTRPLSNTRISSASRIVLSRWAMMKVVRPLHQRLHRPRDPRLGRRVERAGGLVEDQDRRVLQQGAGDRQALPLTAGEGRAALADDGVVALRLTDDELVRVGQAAGALDLLVGRLRPADPQVLADRAVEQHALLEHHADASGAGSRA